MLDFLELSIVSLLEVGHNRILLTGEMTWSIQNTPEARVLARYEDLLNPLATTYPEVTTPPADMTPATRPR